MQVFHTQKALRGSDCTESTAVSISQPPTDDQGKAFSSPDVSVDVLFYIGPYTTRFQAITLCVV